MGKITMLKNVNDGINYYKAYGIFDVSSEVEKLFISKGWAIKSSKKVEGVIEEVIEEIIDPVIDEESLEISENID
jgi:phosphoribosylanthranilate isomerase